MHCSHGSILIDLWAIPLRVCRRSCRRRPQSCSRHSAAGLPQLQSQQAERQTVPSWRRRQRGCGSSRPSRKLAAGGTSLMRSARWRRHALEPRRQRQRIAGGRLSQQEHRRV